MRTKVGLGIDHRKAIVVTITDKGEEMGLISSRVHQQLRRAGDSPLIIRVPMNNSKYRRMIADSEPSRDISTFTTMR